MGKAYRFIQIFRYVPIVQVWFTPQLNRKHFYRALVLFGVVIPFFGSIRFEIMKRKFKKTLDKNAKKTKEQINLSFQQLNIDFKNQTQDYILLIQAHSNNQTEIEMLQDKLYQLNIDIKGNLKQLGDLKAIFMGDQAIYNIFEVVNKAQKIAQEPQISYEGSEATSSRVILVGKDQEMQNKVLLQMPLQDASLQQIIKSISKDKYKKFLGSINF